MHGMHGRIGLRCSRAVHRAPHVHHLLMQLVLCVQAPSVLLYTGQPKRMETLQKPSTCALNARQTCTLCSSCAYRYSSQKPSRICDMKQNYGSTMPYRQHVQTFRQSPMARSGHNCMAELTWACVLHTKLCTWQDHLKLVLLLKICSSSCATNAAFPIPSSVASSGRALHALHGDLTLTADVVVVPDGSVQHCFTRQQNYCYDRCHINSLSKLLWQPCRSCKLSCIWERSRSLEGRWLLPSPMP